MARQAGVALANHKAYHWMASPPLRGSAEWSARRELLGLTRGNHYRAQQLWLQRERIKAVASQVASPGSLQASQQAAGCQAKTAMAKNDVPKPKKSAARLAKRIGVASTRSTSRARRGPTCVCGKQAPPCLERASAHSLRGEPSQVCLPDAPSQAGRVRRVRGLSRAERSCSRHGWL